MFIEQFELALELLAAWKAQGLFILALAESSFFPIPPDILLVSLSIHQPRLALWYALVATVGSVLGGILGYLIGVKAGRPLLLKWVSSKRIEEIERLFTRYGGWAVAIAGFTPIPYKVFTIASGVFRINKTVFVLASLASRGARFTLEGLLFFFAGARAKQLISDYFELATIAVAVALIVLYLLFHNTRLVTNLDRSGSTVKQLLQRMYGKLLRPRRKKGITILSLVLLLVLAKLINELNHNNLLLFDQLGGGWVELIRSPVASKIMEVITTMGSPAVLISIALACAGYLAFFKRHWLSAAAVLVALTSAHLINHGLKLFFQRPRPSIAPLIEVTGYSFPSGHAMVSLALYGMIAYVIWVNSRPGLLKYLTVIFFAFLVTTIGLSRIYLGVHYPSDVMAGFAAGGLWLIVCILALQSLKHRLGKRS